MAKKTVAAKKRNVKVDANGQLHVHSSFNNIIVSLANSEGQIISWSSAGKMGFRGSKKNTPYAAQMAAQDCAKIAYDLGLRKVKAYVTLGWNLNTKNMKAIKSLRVTFSVNNLATITGYSGLSPLINSTTVGGDLGVDDKRFYPLSRTYSLGLSVNF